MAATAAGGGQGAGGRVAHGGDDVPALADSRLLWKPAEENGMEIIRDDSVELTCRARGIPDATLPGLAVVRLGDCTFSHRGGP